MNEAFQPHQDYKSFSLDPMGKYMSYFECDHSANGNCADALKAYQAVPQKRPLKLRRLEVRIGQIHQLQGRS